MTQPTIKILVCDDDTDIAAAIGINLTREGFDVRIAHDGSEAIGALREEPDTRLLILDVMMPVMDGVSALKQIRTFSNVPVIMLTAKSENGDKIEGLDAGADDYVTKPFDPSELMARVRSQVRRFTSLGGVGTVQTADDSGIRLDAETQTAVADGRTIQLTKTEAQILELFLTNPGSVFSPKDIYRTVWNDNPVGAEGTVAVHIRHLREKIEPSPASPRYIKVIWGKGYQFCTDHKH